MYKFERIVLTEGNSWKYLIHKRDKQLSYSDFINALQGDRLFRSFFIQLLSNVPVPAWQWETPPVTTSAIDRPFEFVIHNSPGIDLPPDPGPFQSYFHSTGLDEPVAVFNNLGNDARLIAPKPAGEGRNYSHIGVFIEEAPMKQQHALWRTVGQVTEELISDKPIWLNTAGGGVTWLHVRLDSRPKYYRHRPYSIGRGL
ncbi:MAG: DUF6940 family protein [Balneolaceae bacterium]